jgi:hypothetical protein
MKLFYILLCILLPALASAQSAGVTQADVYVVDGQVRNSVKDIKPGDILEITVLKKDGHDEGNDPRTKDGTTIIITKSYAVSQYQQKFGSLNKKYKEYLDQKHSDSNLSYVLDNVIMNTSRKSAIQQLYDLAPDNIDKVVFKKDPHFTTDATVVISSKNN